MLISSLVENILKGPTFLRMLGASGLVGGGRGVRGSEAAAQLQRPPRDGLQNPGASSPHALRWQPPAFLMENFLGDAASNARFISGRSCGSRLPAPSQGTCERELLSQTPVQRKPPQPGLTPVADSLLTNKHPTVHCRLHRSSSLSRPSDTAPARSGLPSLAQGTQTEVDSRPHQAAGVLLTPGSPTASQTRSWMRDES